MTDTDSLAGKLDELTDELGATAPATAPKRRGAAAPPTQDTATMRLVKRDGILLVEDPTDPVPAAAPPRRRGGTAAVAPATPVWQRELAKLERSQITGWLESLDQKLTSKQGLRRWHDGVLQPADGPPAEGNVLLVVHGTFSNTENILAGIGRNPDDKAFLDWAGTHYSQVLTFEHPTLSVSPMLNARALGLLFTALLGAENCPTLADGSLFSAAPRR